MPSQAQGGAARCAVDESCSRTEEITHGRTQESQSPTERTRDEARDEGRTPVSDPRGRETRARDEAKVREARRECGGCREADHVHAGGSIRDTESGVRGMPPNLTSEGNPSHRGLDWGVCR